MNDFKKIWYKLLYLVLNPIIVFGLITPYLVSLDNDIAVILGFVLVLFNITHLVFFVINLFKQVNGLGSGKQLLILLILGVGFSSCTKVPAGNVGIKFYLLGTSKGVDYEELKPGRYWVGINQELYLFPTFTQNNVWTSSKDEGSPTDDSFNFQDNQGLELNADVGVTYHIDPSKVPLIFQKYKRGIDEITNVFLRNMVRDALVSRSSKVNVEYIYGDGRAALIDSVLVDVKKECDPIGIIVDKIYWIGRIKLPQTVKDAIDAKIKATQIAQQRENELREAEAQAKKLIAEANGIGESIRIKSEAEAKANKVVAASLTPTLVEYEKIKKWDGKVPQVTGSGASIVNIK